MSRRWIIGAATSFRAGYSAVRLHHLTRQELYDMVWSEPMTSLDKSFDVVLAERCRAVDVTISYATIGPASRQA